MNWLTEWKAISAHIEGILQAVRFSGESHPIGHKDTFGVAGKQLVPQIETLLRTLTNFNDSHKDFIPSDAANFLQAQIQIER